MVSITATSANHRVDPADVVPNSVFDAVVKKPVTHTKVTKKMLVTTMTTLKNVKTLT